MVRVCAQFGGLLFVVRVRGTAEDYHGQSSKLRLQPRPTKHFPVTTGCRAAKEQKSRQRKTVTMRIVHGSLDIGWRAGHFERRGMDGGSRLCGTLANEFGLSAIKQVG